MYTEAELERRMERVRVLLDTHDEPYDSLSRNETDAAGFAEPARQVLRCVCSGAGCGQCERSAARAAELGLKLRPGRVLVQERDPYDTGREGSFDPSARTKREEAARIDSILDDLREQELIRAGELAESVDFEELLDAAEARDARGSYRELRAALDVMPRVLRGDAAVRWLALHLPRSIRVPRWAFEAELERLRERVVELKQAGSDISDIAAELSISRRQAKRLLKEATGR